MNEREQKIVEDMIAPIADSVRSNFIAAVVLRCNVAQVYAINNGAELEDMGAVIAQAIEETVPISSRWLNELGDMKRASKIKGLIK